MVRRIRDVAAANDDGPQFAATERMTRVLTGFAVLSLLLLGSVSTSSAQICEAPQVLITVDKSSSMLGNLPAGGTKWDAAVMAITELTSTYATDIDFGMQVFPAPSACAPGVVTMDFGEHAPGDFLTALGEAPPSAGNYTPMQQTLAAAHDHYETRLASGENHLVLITDGWQYCVPHDHSTRFTPVAEVTRLRDLGVTVHVVGFGASVDSLTLNRAAVAAGTDLPGCDATLSEPGAANHCYTQANNLTELRAALAAIARDVTDETCDGLDNDCDGTVDEGYDADEDGYTTCGSDPTMPGTPIDPTIVDCDDTAVAINPGAEEICDGIDNDCDGSTDPGCDCLVGDERPCGIDMGVCERGTQTCETGAWGLCEGGVTPGEAESCDGMDEDCDGTIDEDADASCAEGEVCRPEGCVPLTPPMEEEEMEDPPMPPEERGEGDLMMESGCACRAGAPTGSSRGAWALMGLLGLVAWRRRR
ncbi:MAG: MopE-related protein [Sandaracinaceae bacterium]